MIEHRSQLIQKFLPRLNFPLLRRSSLQHLFSSNVDNRWTTKTCGNGIFCEYLSLVYFGIHLLIIIWFLVYLLWWKDRIHAYQIWWRLSQFYFLMYFTILYSIDLRLDVVPLFCWFFPFFVRLLSQVCFLMG